MSAILNATQHNATPDQGSAGVVEPGMEVKAELKRLLTFTSLPTREEVAARAAAITDLVAEEGVTAAMIGGAPYLMGALEGALKDRGITPVYAYSERRSVEKTDPISGEVTKTAVFVHLGFVEV